MGGIGIGLRNNFQINSGNPASYTAIDSLSFLMEFGVNSKHTRYETESAKNGSNDVNFDYLAFSFPIKKWWATSFGLLPFSQKGYNITTTGTNNNVTSSTSFNGTGALSKFFIGSAFNITKNISLGVNTWFMFGTLIDQSYTYFPNDADAYDYLNSENLYIHNFGVTTGIQYHFQTKNKNTVTIGAVFEPKQNLSMDYTIHEERALFRGSSTQSAIVDTLTHVVSNDQKFILPMSYGAGFSYAIKNKIIFGADYFHQQWSKTNLPTTQQYVTNKSRYSAGLEWTPDENSITSYWDRTKYRGGAFYEKSYLVINGEQLNSYGLTFGLGLPFPRSRSTFNLSAELGRMGSKENNLLQESYVKFTLHFLIYDRWFMKRKFD